MIDRYGCEETFRSLQDYLDRELTPSQRARVDEHLRHCEACLQEFEFEASLLRHLKQKLQSSNLAPPGLMERISQALAEE